jgi:hypothetical protein
MKHFWWFLLTLAIALLLVVTSGSRASIGDEPLKIGRVANMTSRYESNRISSDGLELKIAEPQPLRISIYSDGQAMYRNYASNVYLPAKRSYFKLARPEESLTFFMKGEFQWFRNLFILRGKATDGAIWSFHDFKSGSYLVQFTYSNENARKEIRWRSGKFSAWHDLWVGQVSTPQIEFCLTSS